jgi:hypothetical protein
MPAFCQSLAAATAIGAALSMASAGMTALGANPTYPDWQSQWANPQASAKGTPWDPTKPMGLPQNPPLTPKYQAIFAGSVAAQATGGTGNDPRARCVLDGMPRIMSLDGPMEILIRRDFTEMIFQNALPRRIYTDGRNWPDEAATFQGYSIGKWIDDDGDGRYDALEVETRNFAGPRVLEASGLPLDDDNETIVKERLYLDKIDSDILHDQITTIDHAFTHPWTVLKTYARQRDTSKWAEYNCEVATTSVFIGSDEYRVSGDGKLMPIKKGQPPPDLQYFK